MTKIPPEMNLWVVIPASGIGSRFGIDKPKQYLSIGGKTVLEHSLEIFLHLNWVNKIVVAVSKEDDYIHDLALTLHKKITVIQGGESRAQTIMKAMAFLKSDTKIDDWVLTHDAVRPCLHQEDLFYFFQSLRNDPVGGILAAKVVDTLKRGAGRVVSHTVERNNLWQALTPQMFRFDLLDRALNFCEQNQIEITDDASAIEKLGLKVKLIEAKHPNPKLTFSRDRDLISCLLQQKMNEEIPL